jgi:hypothetical protein
MAAFLAFLSAHQVVLASVASLLIQEFLANASFIKANSIGQLIIGWVQGRLAAISGKPSA